MYTCVYTHVYICLTGLLVFVWCIPGATSRDPGASCRVMRFSADVVFFSSLGIHKSTQHNSRSKKIYFAKNREGTPEAPPPPLGSRGLKPTSTAPVGVHRYIIQVLYLDRCCCIALTAPRNADVPVHMYEGRGNVTVEYTPSEVGELSTVSNNKGEPKILHWGGGARPKCRKSRLKAEIAGWGGRPSPHQLGVWGRAVSK